MRKLLAGAIGLITAMILVVYWSGDHSEKGTTAPAPISDRASPPSQEQIHIHEFAAKGRVPAFYESAPPLKTLPVTLSPEVYTGNKRLAYLAAREIPQVLAQLPCYCHCDRSIGHKSLHSCFESEHGENCGICIGEAVMAYNLTKQGVGATEIRRRIIESYGQ